MGGPELLEGEKLIMELMPHPLAFMRYISICIYYLAVGIGFKYLIEKYLPQLAPRFQGVLTTPGAPIALLVWWALILAVPLIVGIFHITFWPLVCSVLMGVAGTALVLKFNLGPDHLSLLTVASGVLGFFVVEFYRRGHRYYITDQRIIITKKFVSKEERILRYEAITDVVVHKGLMGRIFDFGDVIPITMSGLGLGEDLAGVAVGKEVKKLGVEMAAVGGRTVKVPRELLEELMELVPGRYEVVGAGGRKWTVGGGERHCLAIVTDPWILDYDTGRLRRPCLADVVRHTRIAQMLERVVAISLMDYPVADFPGPTSSLHAMEEHIINHDKHIYVLPTSVESLERWLRVGRILLRGGELNGNRLMTVGVAVLSPLTLTEMNGEFLLIACHNDLPVVPTVCPMAGTTSPYSKAGTLVLAHAENLFLAALTQMVRPGSLRATISPCLRWLDKGRIFG